MITCFQTQEGCYCCVKGFDTFEIKTKLVCNEWDCPLLQARDTIEVIYSNQVLYAVSVVHQCTHTCTFQTSSVGKIIEREEIVRSSLHYKHDEKNNMFYLNVYTVN